MTLGDGKVTRYVIVELLQHRSRHRSASQAFAHPSAPHILLSFPSPQLDGLTFHRYIVDTNTITLHATNITSNSRMAKPTVSMERGLAKNLEVL